MKKIHFILLCVALVFYIGSTSATSKNTLNNNELLNKENITATFDGAEGDYFFFTDENNKALQFDSISALALQNYKLVDEDNIGKVFKIQYKDSKIIDLEVVKK